MIDNRRLDASIREFVHKFNKMCETERKDFLVRERTVNYESGSRIKRYQITYRLRKRKNEWLLEGVTSGFWIFRRRFPLLRVKRKNNLVSFSGMFTHIMKDFKEEQIQEKLNEYLEICKRQRQDVFTRS